VPDARDGRRARPVAPFEDQRDIAAAISAHLVRYEEFANCGHGVVPDAPDDAMALLREFIAG
jgi:proline iminopeptidase